jgi:hypothetical protein
MSWYLSRSLALYDDDVVVVVVVVVVVTHLLC